uniref:Uncharacterized protein n=1 Tax=Glossina pallidipes TaxID=7398 RepID=A0A1B0A5D7_GLOPL
MYAKLATTTITSATTTTTTITTTTTTTTTTASCVNETPPKKCDFGDCREHRTLKFMGVLLVSNKGTSTSASNAYIRAYMDLSADVAVTDEQITNVSALATVLSKFDSQLLLIGKVSSSDQKAKSENYLTVVCLIVPERKTMRSKKQKMLSTCFLHEIKLKFKANQISGVK